MPLLHPPPPLVAKKHPKTIEGEVLASNRIHHLLSPVDKTINLLTGGYVRLVSLALRHRGVTATILLIFMVFTMRMVKPLLGGEQMPPMDTGIVSIQWRY